MDIKEDVESDLQEGITDPLMRVEKNLADGGSSRGGNQWMVYLSTFVAVCGSYEFGCCIGYSSPTQSAIREDLSLTLAEALRVSCAFCVAGWLAIYFSKGALSLDIGRLATGYGMGAFSYVVPVFIAEIAPKNLRGRLTAINQLMIISGVSISFIIGVLVSWRALALIGLVPCAVTIFGLFFIPESPRWLAKTGRQREFEMALQKLRGKDADISHEAAEIQIAVGLMVFQQLGGINGVCFYVSNIFEQAGFSSSVGTITYAILQVVVTAVAASVMDKAGRKPLILVSASGLVLGSLLTAISFFLKVHELALTATPILAVIGILIYIGSFSIGMGAVPWIVMSEIFPINIKGQAGSFATLVNWLGAWLCSYTFNFLMSWSSYGTFILYAAINALAILFVILTAGMAIKEDVESDLQDGIRAPLVRVENNLVDGDGSADGGSSRGGNPWMVYLSTFVAVCGSYEFGCCALRVSSAFCVAGWLAIYFSKEAWSLDIGRLANGYGMGAFSYVVPVFIAEIAPKNLRGRLTAINQLMICGGVSVSFIIGVLVSWRALALIGLIPCAVNIFGLFFIPESPRWLAKKGRHKEFEVALQKLRGKDADISHEAAEIQIGVGLMVCQQFGGINGVCFYVSDIFDQAGFSSSIGTITYAILQVVVTGIGAAVMDKAGRKPLILVSASGVVLGCLLTAVSFFLKVHELALTATPILAVTGILFYIGSFSIGMGAVPWVVMSEIFPINIKGQAGSLATLVNWFGAWLCSYTFNYLMSWSSYGTFILYAAINALAILFVTLMSPLLRAIAGVHKSTPFPVGFTNYSESYGSEVSEYLAFRGVIYMAIKEQNDAQEIREPLVWIDNNLAAGDGSGHGSTKGDEWMVYLSTFVAVCGSYEFGCGVGYSSPTQSAIRKDLNLSIAEAMRMSCVFCVAGWLAIYFSKGALSLDIGRLATGNIQENEDIDYDSSSVQAKTGRQRDFEVALQKLRGKDADVSHEAAEIQVVVTGLGAAVMDKAGRKPLILVSASGLVLGCVLIATSFFLKIFIGSFSIGMGAVPWVLMSEIFPINIKGQAGSLTTLVNWLGAWLCSYTFNFLMSWSSYGTFILYAVVNVLSVLFVIVIVPETKGKTLEQIQGAINK
ncbi:hypothetical protein ACE6H2_028632 [Prunus campanulata]